MVHWYWLRGNLNSTESSVPIEKHPKWRQPDILLCNILQQSIEPKTLDNLGYYQTCSPLWTQAKKLYTNDVQCLYRVISSIDSLEHLEMKLSSLLDEW